MDLDQRILTRCGPKSKKDREARLPAVYKWIAENQSRQPATITETLNWLPSIQGSREALMCIFLALYLPDWETWEVSRSIGQQCYNQRYQGKWEQVQVFLEQATDLPKFYELFLAHVGREDDFFGNFLRNCESFLKKNQRCFRKDRTRYRRPKEKVYRRGYQDKGSLRPSHQRGRNLPDPNPGPDRRSKIQFKSYPY